MKEVGLIVAKLAKEAGFDGYTKDYYADGEKNSNPYMTTEGVRQWNQVDNSSDTEYLAAPLQPHLREWMRREHNVHVMISYTGRYFAKYKMGYGAKYYTAPSKHKDYYYALDTALKEGLNLIIRSK